VGNGPANSTDSSGLKGEPWYNNDWTDWINPVAIGTDFGERIGTGWGTWRHHDLGLSFELYALRQERIVRELADPESTLTTADIASERLDILGDGLRETGDYAYKIADGAVATGELTVEVVGVAKGGLALRRLARARKVVRPLTQAQESAIRKINNIEQGHLKPHDFTGTLRDMIGNPVRKPGGGFWDHAQEMNNSLRGLRKHAKTLEGATDPAAVEARQRALEWIKKIEEHTRGAGI